MRNQFLVFLLSSAIFLSCDRNRFTEVLLRDDFSQLDTGLFSAPVGPHTEYHYLPEAGTKGNWVVSSFASGGGWGTAWRVKNDGAGNIMCQTMLNGSNRSTHPMIVAGDSLWRDYKIKVKFRPEDDSQYSGIAFRYRNDRCFYFFGIRDSSAYISIFNHGLSFNTLNEKILASRPFVFSPGQDLAATVTVRGNAITAVLNDDIILKVIDDTFLSGKIGLVSNAKAEYRSVEVLTSKEDISDLENGKAFYELESQKLQDSNPKMVVWKKIKTSGFGVGRNLRFGDLDGDGQTDVLIGQVIHHAWPRDSHSELSCLTAMTFDGKILWQTGEPDPEKNHLTNDVGFQIIDLDKDGKNEVVYCRNFQIMIADAATGKPKYMAPTPKSKIKDDRFSQILGDCLFFFDAEGKGWDSDILIKDRYTNFWVLDSRLRLLWEGSCKTGHYPFASDIDNDGKDELAIGYSLYDNDGKMLWCLDEKIDDHADGVAIADFDQNAGTEPVILYSASNAGYLRVDLKGNILEHYFNGHVQNPAVANFRTDLPGLETVTINFWGNQGIVHFYDMDGKIYHDFEPNQFGSMCLPLNWTGSGEEYFIHNPNVREGGIFDGWGRKVLQFPDDGHPDMCNAVLDLTGDCRDEIVVWNPDEIWIYTQNDNPKTGKLYKPERNPLYNYSNYQATVSLPGWSEQKIY
jgi:rhamnogalacturonan endolyase